MQDEPMIQQAEWLGFTFSRKGCPCNGTPLVYIKRTDTNTYTLTLWTRRNTWRLATKGCVIATGNQEDMTTKIQSIWD